MSTHHSQIASLEREIAGLHKTDAAEAKKEADLVMKANRAADSARQSKSVSTVQMKLREAERAMQELASVKKKRADISEKLSRKSKSLREYEARQTNEDEKKRKKLAEENKKLMRERTEYNRQISIDMQSRIRAGIKPITPTSPADSYDFFISHASEDKQGFVRELAETLRARGARVWYDEFSLKVGDSLRRTIDRGLANSKFGIVVLSEAFFCKEWPQRELDGLVAREIQGELRVLPIWHKVTVDEVARYSPPLADKLALSTATRSISDIATELMGLIEPSSDS